MLAALLLNLQTPTRGIVRRGQEKLPAKRRVELRVDLISTDLHIEARTEKVEGFDYSIMAAVAMIIAME